MSLDPNVSSPASGSPHVSAIENEFPTYRAISPHAIFSLIFGILAALCFTNLTFLVCSVLAVLLGLYAQRAIRRFSDVLTGIGFAQAGIALGLVFGLAALTTTTVQDYIRSYEAKRFARHYISVLQSGQLDSAIYYTVNPDGREGKTPQEVLKELEASVEHPMQLQSLTGGVKGIIARVNSTKGQTVHFSKLEDLKLDGLDVVASALIDIDGPTSKDHPDAEEFALLAMRGVTRKGKLQWWFYSVVYPYKPGSFVIAPKKPDDGHGHSH